MEGHEDLSNVDDGGTQELLARLSHHVSSQLDVAPPPPDPHGEQLLRTMLYGELLDGHGAGERVEDVVGPSARREADEAAVLRSALMDGAERMLAEHAQTVCAVPTCWGKAARALHRRRNICHVVRTAAPSHPAAGWVQLRNVGDVTVRSQRNDDVSEGTEHVVGHVLDRLRRLMAHGEPNVAQQPNATLQTLRGDGLPRAASRDARPAAG